MNPKNISHPIDLRPVPGYKGYEASADGRVWRRTATGRLVPVGRIPTGSRLVSVVGGERVAIEKLVARAFLPPEPGKPYVLFRDGNRYYTAARNLYRASLEEVRQRPAFWARLVDMGHAEE